VVLGIVVRVGFGSRAIVNALLLGDDILRDFLHLFHRERVEIQTLKSTLNVLVGGLGLQFPINIISASKTDRGRVGSYFWFCQARTADPTQ
jgi:hypothetical protein